MRVALINPATPAALKKENLGLAYLAACLEPDGHDVCIVDEIRGQDVEEGLDAFRPDVVGISAMTMFAPRAYALADRIRAGRGIPVILGGAHPTALPEEAMRHADCVIRGEGERSLPRVLMEGRIEGIVEPDPPTDLDALPMPKRDLLDLEFYASAGDELAGHSYRTLGLITSRGCPYRCTFCANSKREAKLRFHSPERVVEELHYLVGCHRIQSVAFYDEMMATDAARLQAICERMAQQDLHSLKWECQMHPRSIKPALLAEMRRAGCLQVAVGFESGSQRVLDRINKGVTLEQNLEAARRVKEAGLRLRGCFIMGTPGETLADLDATERFIGHSRTDFASIHFLTPMPGTLLFDEFAERIAEAGIPWDRFTAGDPGTFTCNDAMSRDEQRRMFRLLVAKYAMRNYPWREAFRKALRNPRHAWAVIRALVLGR